MTRDLLFILMSLLILSGCMEEDDPVGPGDPGNSNSSRGVFIVNEGNFTFENASLTYYNIGSGEESQDIFFNTNGLPLGDVAVSMNIQDSLGYVVLNNSGKIYMLHTGSFALKGKITGLTSPRYIHFINDTKAYVTDLYARSIAIVNPVAMEITGYIDVNNGQDEFGQHSTEQMIGYGEYVYSNCWSYDNQILVIDSETDRVVDSIEVIKQPNSMVMDNKQSLWVLSDGGWIGSPYGYETPGLVRVDPASGKAETIHRFEEGDRPTALRINPTSDTIYYLDRHVYRMSVDPLGEPAIFISSPYEEGFWGGFYGLAVDPVSSEVYVTDAVDFSQPGVVYRYAPDGNPVDTIVAGIVPGALCFTP
jgi:DNA-binding beta-propeller fold protein YncE